MRCIPCCVRVSSLLLMVAFAFAKTGSAGAAGGNAAAQPAMVIGFVGGFVKHDSAIHSTVQVAKNLHERYPTNVYVQAFENRHRKRAYREILRRLDLDQDGTLSTEEKRAARIIIFGHSWGASETVALARKLDEDGIPVLLTIQVDSIAKVGENDAVIPDNVEEAVNFYQPNGVLHGRSAIRAADPSRTQIVGNFRFDYKANPVGCQDRYPWLGRIVMRSHLEIECDPKVWTQIESMIYSKLSPETPDAAAEGVKTVEVRSAVSE